MLRSRAATLLGATVVGAVFLAGLFVHGRVGAALLLLVAVLLGVLTASTWPQLAANRRTPRVLVIVAVVVVAVLKLVR